MNELRTTQINLTNMILSKTSQAQKSIIYYIFPLTQCLKQAKLFYGVLSHLSLKKNGLSEGRGRLLGWRYHFISWSGWRVYEDDNMKITQAVHLWSVHFCKFMFSLKSFWNYYISQEEGTIYFTWRRLETNLKIDHNFARQKR